MGILNLGHKLLESLGITKAPDNGGFEDLQLRTKGDLINDLQTNEQSLFKQIENFEIQDSNQINTLSKKFNIIMLSIIKKYENFEKVPDKLKTLIRNTIENLLKKIPEKPILIYPYLSIRNNIGNINLILLDDSSLINEQIVIATNIIKTLNLLNQNANYSGILNKYLNNIQIESNNNPVIKETINALICELYYDNLKQGFDIESDFLLKNFNLTIDSNLKETIIAKRYLNLLNNNITQAIEFKKNHNPKCNKEIEDKENEIGTSMYFESIKYGNTNNLENISNIISILGISISEENKEIARKEIIKEYFNLIQNEIEYDTNIENTIENIKKYENYLHKHSISLNTTENTFQNDLILKIYKKYLLKGNYSNTFKEIVATLKNLSELKYRINPEYALTDNDKKSYLNLYFSFFSNSQNISDNIIKDIYSIKSLLPFELDENDLIKEQSYITMSFFNLSENIFTLGNNNSNINPNYLKSISTAKELLKQFNIQLNTEELEKLKNINFNNYINFIKYYETHDCYAKALCNNIKELKEALNIYSLTSSEQLSEANIIKSIYKSILSKQLINNFLNLEQVTNQLIILKLTFNLNFTENEIQEQREILIKKYFQLIELLGNKNPTDVKERVKQLMNFKKTFCLELNQTEKIKEKQYLEGIANTLNNTYIRQAKSSSKSTRKNAGQFRNAANAILKTYNSPSFHKSTKGIDKDWINNKLANLNHEQILEIFKNEEFKIQLISKNPSLVNKIQSEEEIKKLQVKIYKKLSKLPSQQNKIKHMKEKYYSEYPNRANDDSDLLFTYWFMNSLGYDNSSFLGYYMISQIDPTLGMIYLISNGGNNENSFVPGGGEFGGAGAQIEYQNSIEGENNQNMYDQIVNEFIAIQSEGDQNKDTSDTEKEDNDKDES